MRCVDEKDVPTLRFPSHQTANQRKRLRFEKEEQRRERSPTYKISRNKRYKACSDVWAIYEKDATRKYPSLSIDTACSNTGNKLPSDAYRKILPKTPESPSVPYIPCQDKQLESADRSICLDTLEMQYYRLLIREPALGKHLESKRHVLYSSTCRGTSLVYPQDNAAIFAGFCSKAIKKTRNIAGAMLSIWSLDDLSLQHFEENGELFDTICSNGWCVKISPTLMEQLYSQRREKLPNETGGILIGSYDFSRNVCYIVDSIVSPPDSKEYPNAYIRGCKGLLEHISRIEECTIENLTYIGEWHSHPTASTKASSDDMVLLKSIRDYTRSWGNPGCMLIVGEGNYTLYIDAS